VLHRTYGDNAIKIALSLIFWVALRGRYGIRATIRKEDVLLKTIS